MAGRRLRRRLPLCQGTFLSAPGLSFSSRLHRMAGKAFQSQATGFSLNALSLLDCMFPFCPVCRIPIHTLRGTWMTVIPCLPAPSPTRLWEAAVVHKGLKRQNWPGSLSSTLEITDAIRQRVSLLCKSFSGTQPNTEKVSKSVCPCAVHMCVCTHAHSHTLITYFLKQ